MKFIEEMKQNHRERQEIKKILKEKNHIFF